jgi:small neutral amino acid transporter SnatA (MarC family)
MENPNIIPIIIAIFTGAFTLLASLLNWDFFFKHKRTQFFVKRIGRKGARVFYAVMGLILFFFAYKMITG